MLNKEIESESAIDNINTICEIDLQVLLLLGFHVLLQSICPSVDKMYRYSLDVQQLLYSCTERYMHGLDLNSANMLFDHCDVVRSDKCFG